MTATPRPVRKPLDRTEDSARPDRKPYSAPRLTDYGSIGKLTRGGSGTVGEAGVGMMLMCL